MSKIDYTPYLHVTENGRIWWPRMVAIRLGAGFLPVCDNHQVLQPEVRAPDQRALVNERTLIGALGDARLQLEPPAIVEREGFQYVEAGEFLEWLSQYIAQTQADIESPNHLIREVRRAKAEAAETRGTEPTKPFESLTLALESWFDTRLDDLPDRLRERARVDFFPFVWDDLSTRHRRSIALQWDYRNDPATEEERHFWWEFFLRMDDIKKQISDWKAVATPTAGDLAQKEARLKELQHALDGMELQRKTARGDYYPTPKAPDAKGATTHDAIAPQYIPYPKAMKLLTERLKATPEELAAWVWAGPDDQGLAAYLNANELDPPRPFSYQTILGGDFDYVAPLMACWFKEDDIARFDPADRYITGHALLERWSQHPNIRSEAFILAKIRESRLLDVHPLFGSTQGTRPGDVSLPPLASGLFALSQVQGIEAEDALDIGPTQSALVEEQASPAASNLAPEGQLQADDPFAAFHCLEGLLPREITITIVGDRSESGLAGNNLLEISARDVRRRVSVAEFDLVDRRSGVLNRQGAILVGLAEGREFFRSTAKISAITKRLRGVFRARLGITADPFQPYNPQSGWRPQFSIIDARGKADDRAREQAEKGSLSLDQLADQGFQLAAGSDDQHQFDDEEDAAGRWLRGNDQ